MFSRSALRTLRVSRLTRSIPITNPLSRIQAMYSSAPGYSTVTSVQTDKAKCPFKTKSQAIKAAGHVWLSGQIPTDTQGNLIQGSTNQKTKAIIENTRAILQEAGSGLDRVVKMVVYVKDASIMPDFASVYDPAFPHRPARSMMEVSKLPAGVDIQVDFIAVV